MLSPAGSMGRGQSYRQPAPVRPRAAPAPQGARAPPAAGRRAYNRHPHARRGTVPDREGASCCEGLMALFPRKKGDDDEGKGPGGNGSAGGGGGGGEGGEPLHQSPERAAKFFDRAKT